MIMNLFYIKFLFMSFWLWSEDPNRFINRRNEVSVCTSDAISPKKEILRPNFLAQWSTRDGFKRFSNPLKWVIYIIWEVFTERILIAIKGIFCISILVPISITPRASGTKQHGFFPFAHQTSIKLVTLSCISASLVNIQFILMQPFPTVCTYPSPFMQKYT